MAVSVVRADRDTDPDIADIAALEPSDGDMLYWATGGTRYNATSSQSFGRSLLNTSSELAFKQLANIEATDFVKTVADNSTLTALTAATGLIDNGLYRTLGRASERDGGDGFWVYDSASTSTANTGTILAINGGGAGRFFRVEASILNPLWFASELGAGLTAAASAMAATYGRIRVPPGSYTQTTQATFPQTKNFYMVEMEGCRINITYTGGASYKFGDGTAQTQFIVLKGFGTYIDQGNSVNQPLFETRGVRGFYTYGFRGANLYQLHKWGDGADASLCFLWWHGDCEWQLRANSLGGHDHAINANGSRGGYYESGVAIEGDAERVVANKAYFYLDANQGASRFDKLARGGGSVIKYFDYGLYAENARIVNVDLDGTSRMDDCGLWAIRIKATAAGTKGGCEAVNIKGTFGGGHEGGGIWLSNESGAAAATFQNVFVHGVQSANLTEAFFKAETTGTGAMNNVHVIDNHMGDMNTSSNSVDCIVIDGDITEVRISGNTMTRKNASTYTPRYLIYNNTASTKAVWITNDNASPDCNTGIVYDPNVGDLSIGRWCQLRTDGTPRLSHSFTFHYANMAASLTNALVGVEATTIAFRHIAPARGRVIANTIAVNGTITAGTVTAGLSQSGAISGNFDAAFTSASGADPAAVVDYKAGSTAYAAADNIQFRVTTDGSLSPTTLDLLAKVTFLEM